MPMPLGGWRGCYCDWSCVDDHLIDIETNGQGTIDVLIVAGLIQRFMKQIHEQGLQDVLDSSHVRSPDDPIQASADGTIFTSIVEDSDLVPPPASPPRQLPTEFPSAVQPEYQLSDKFVPLDETILSITDQPKSRSELIDQSNPNTITPTELKIESPDQLTAYLASPAPITIMYFYAPWCGHCRRFKPHLKAAVSHLPNATLVKINVDQPSLRTVATSYQVTGLPTTLIVSGASMERVVGANVDEVVAAASSI